MDSVKTWTKILDYIKDQISSGNFRTWFSQTEIGELTEDTLQIIVPSAFIKNQLSARYEVLIGEATNQIIGKPLTISYIIDASKAFKVPTPIENEAQLFQFLPPSHSTQASNLNPKYTLKNFVVGLTNNLAFAAAQAVVQNPGMSYNPLFIYGPSGVGKTHLMQGIGNELLAKTPHLKLIYAPSEKFMNDFVNSIQNKKMGDFRAKYRQCDLLFIDDIQFISGKDSMQEEFFHTFNELQGKNVQIVLTSDRPPNEIQRLESRLASRFQGGLMVDVQLPDFDTRVAILRAKLAEQGDFLSEDIINLIADSVAANTRELEGKLIQIVQASKLTHQEATLEFAQRFLANSTPVRPQNIDQKQVMSVITAYFNVKAADLTGPRRQKELVFPRQIAMFLMYEECKIPMEKVGQILGDRDHTTIMHGVDKIRQAFSRDREVQRVIIEIKQQLIS